MLNALRKYGEKKKERKGKKEEKKKEKKKGKKENMEKSLKLCERVREVVFNQISVKLIIIMLETGETEKNYV